MAAGTFYAFKCSVKVYRALAKLLAAMALGQVGAFVRKYFH